MADRRLRLWADVPPGLEYLAMLPHGTKGRRCSLGLLAYEGAEPENQDRLARYVSISLDSGLRPDPAVALLVLSGQIDEREMLRAATGLDGEDGGASAPGARCGT